MKPRTTAYLSLLLVSVIWGAAPAIIKFTLTDFPPLVFLTYRFFISTVIAVGWLFATGQKLPAKYSQWKDIIGYSIIGVTIALGLLFLGFDKTTSLTGNILTSLGPLLTIAAGSIFLHERVTSREKTGVGLALAGTLVVVVAPLVNGAAGDVLGRLEGNILIVVAILADAGSAILAKFALRKKVSAVLLAHLSFVVGLVTLAPLALRIHGWEGILASIRLAPISAHLGVWYMAVLSGTIAYSLRNRAVQTIEVSEASVFSYLMPIFGLPLSVLWLGEKLTLPYILGAGIIAVGVFLAERKRRRKK